MISFIFTSILLSAVAWLLYFFLIRGKATYSQQKGFIYFSLAASLLLPLTVSFEADYFPAPNPTVKPLAFGQKIDHSQLTHYCRCENPNYSHRISYRANSWYNFLFDYKNWVGGIISLAVGALVMSFFLQLLFLIHLVHSSEKKQIVLQNTRFFLLKTRKRLGTGAFRLKDKFIIWQPEMDSLSENELHAVFLHELSHLHQWNTLEKAILKMIQCFWFANPFFYFFREELDFLSECIADAEGARAFSNRKAYANLLLNLKSLQHIPLVQHFKGNSLRRRIETLLTDTTTSSPGLGFLPGLMLVLTLQILMVQPVSATVSQTIHDLETYEEIYHKIVPGQTEAVYCTDCETVCFP
ncbi:MAG: M56 family metallopeptidase [Bacteroidia bacterium]